MRAPMQTIRGFIRPIVADAVRVAKSHGPARSTDGTPRNDETLLDFLAQSLDGTSLPYLAHVSQSRNLGGRSKDYRR